MTTSASSVNIYKSENVSDTASNGGRIGDVPVVFGGKYNLFPRVTKAEATAGKTRDRKIGIKTKAPGEEALYNVMAWVGFPSPAGDHFQIANSTPHETQTSWNAAARAFVGVGLLSTTLSGSEVTVDIQMDDNTFAFLPGEHISISNKLMVAQTIESTVAEGDCVQYNDSSSEWEKISTQNDFAYPKGLYVGDNKVYTVHGSATEEFLRVKDKEYMEAIGTGDGTISPTMSALSNVTNGVYSFEDKPAYITATCGSVERTVSIDGDGACSGYCSSGELNLSDGTWTTPISFTTPPDNGTNIVAHYNDKAYSWNSNIVTVELEDPVANPYSTDDTVVAGCISMAEVKSKVENFTVTSSGGSYDVASYPVELDNRGAVSDTFTLTFTNGTSFSVSGLKEGLVGTGNVTADFAIERDGTGYDYFTLRHEGFSGSFSSGDTIVIEIVGGAFPIVCREVIPAATASAGHNFFLMSYYWE